LPGLPDDVDRVRRPCPGGNELAANECGAGGDPEAGDRLPGDAGVVVLLVDAAREIEVSADLDPPGGGAVHAELVLAAAGREHDRRERHPRGGGLLDERRRSDHALAVNDERQRQAKVDIEPTALDGQIERQWLDRTSVGRVVAAEQHTDCAYIVADRVGDHRGEDICGDVPWSGALRGGGRNRELR